jgi:hypothetical protein
MDLYRDRFELKVIDNTLFFHLEGAMDEGLIKAIFIKVLYLVENELKEPWASIMDLTQWGLYTPEAEKDLIKFQHWAYKKGQRAEVCVVAGNSFKEGIRKKIYAQQNLDVEHIFVDTLEDGKDWLIENGYLKSIE